MPIIRALVELDSTTGLPEDRATNTYHFDCSGIGPSNRDNVMDLIEDLYATEPTATPLINMMSNDLCEGTGRVTLYNLDDAEPRAPIDSREFSATPASVSGMPAEVALVVSFEALPVSGEVQARRRGRIYMPWLTDTANTVGRPEETFVNGVCESFTEFLAAADASTSTDWVIWSPTNESAVGVARGWVDNAWDTQRRRGFAATTRTLIPYTP